MRIRSFLVLALPVASLAAACGSSTDTAPVKAGGTTSSSGSSSSSTGAAGGAGTSSSSSSSGAGGGGGGGPSDVYPAFKPVPPQEVSLGGPVLKAPKIYPIYFSNDDAAFTGKLSEFYAKVGGTAYWQAVGTEYGVGAATGEAPIELAETSTGTIDDMAIQTWLAGKLNANDPAFPKADADTVFAINYPTGVSITQGGQASCVAFGGYHNSTTLDALHGGASVAYAVIPRCSDFDGFTGIDAVTAAASHELIEAATDPYPSTNPANAQLDNAHFYWVRALGGAEVGDLCAQSLASFTTFAELPFMVQRSWSNKEAKALHDPCVPALPGLPYFNTAPVLPDAVTLTLGPQTLMVKGVTIALNETKAVELDLFSDGPTAAWNVEVLDVAQLTGKPTALKFALDKKKGQNGEKISLSITVLVEGKHKTETFLVSSTLGKQQNMWVGIVGNP